ncbi:MAG: FMN-dependent NADH-azoreductase [Henriciella sp.]
MDKATNILRIDASARRTGSITRSLTNDLIDHLSHQGPITLSTRDLAKGVPLLDEDWINANFTDDVVRTPEQRAKLQLSDELVDELEEADLIVIGLPIYNFGVPAALKAWVDLVARARVTFRYTEAGPKGLLQNKRAIALVASGGTPVGSDIDYATAYLRHALNFIGIEDVTFISADRLATQAEDSLDKAQQAIKSLV